MVRRLKRLASHWRSLFLSCLLGAGGGYLVVDGHHAPAPPSTVAAFARSLDSSCFVAPRGGPMATVRATAKWLHADHDFKRDALAAAINQLRMACQDSWYVRIRVEDGSGMQIVELRSTPKSVELIPPDFFDRPDVAALRPDANVFNSSLPAARPASTGKRFGQSPST